MTEPDPPRDVIWTPEAHARKTQVGSVVAVGYANGLFVSPQVGLRVPLARVELSAAARYHHLYTGYTLETVEDRRKRWSTGSRE